MRKLITIILILIAIKLAAPIIIWTTVIATVAIANLIDDNTTTPKKTDRLPRTTHQ